ncbi:hypothetical protein [Streptomyces arenae]|uniref:hypothetical protein n=1 Tax=Streptomyces arenae TaxID=29301 RepID=UPI0026584755|nr:hypothetical protein [Streptomyces arenae]MCG7204154.1 hypothetical protein [Streptomyces arenae]
MNSLIDPLDEGQQCLVDIVWSTFAEHGRFPAFFYVEYVMRRNGHDAAAVLSSFPAVGTLLTRRYRAVDWWGAGHSPDRDGPVVLTMAGLYHVHDDPTAKVIRDALLAFMRECSREQEAILASPFTMPPVDLDLDMYVKVAGVPGAYVGHMAEVAKHEWPGVRYNEGSRSGHLGWLGEVEFATVEDYLVSVSAALSPPEPPAALSYAEPRALLRAINFLDVTSELVLGSRLVARPPMDRSSLLALDVEDEAGFHAGLVVLTEILRDFKVPGSTPPSGLGRLESHLVGLLPTIDRAVVHQAVERLDQIRIVRNSAVHPKPSSRLLTAHQALGLPFPVRDFAAAWDSVRAHAERELSRVQEAVQAARP